MSVKAKSDRVYWEGGVDVRKFADDELFRRLWWRTEGVPGSYTRLNAAVLYTEACKMADGFGPVVEIGVDQGRSMSMLLGVGEVTGVRHVLVDSWESVLVENKAKVEKLIREFPRATAEVLHMKSEDAARKMDGVQVGMLHIDACHYSPMVDKDFEVWLPKLRLGGVVLCHDYASTFDDVTRCVDEYTDGWEDMGSWDSLAVRRKPL